MKWEAIKAKFNMGVVAKVILILAAAFIVWHFWLRPDEPKAEAPPAATKTSVADDAEKLLTAPKAPVAPEPIVVTQVIERVIEQTVVMTQVVERVVQTAPATMTNTVEVASPQYEFTQWVEHRTGTEVGTITNREGQVVQAKMKVDREIISGGGNEPIQIFRPITLAATSAQPQTVVATAPATTSVNHSPAPVATGQSGSRQSYYINPFAKPTTGGEAFMIDPSRAKKR